MKLLLHRQQVQRGSALVIVLVLLSVMAALVLGNVTTLRRLKTELQLLEMKQQRAFNPPAAKPSPVEQPANRTD